MKDIGSWDCKELIEWLCENSLDMYSKTFTENKIDVCYLPMKKFYIDSVGHRLQILRRIGQQVDYLNSPEEPLSAKTTSPSAKDPISIRIYGNQVIGRENEQFKSVKANPLDDGKSIVQLAMQKFKIIGTRQDYFLILSMTNSIKHRKAIGWTG
jgi:hypothetical protein